MHVEKESIEKTIERLRAAGAAVPLAVIAYNVERDQFQMCLLDDVDAEEAQVLLRKLSLEIILP